MKIIRSPKASYNFHSLLSIIESVTSSNSSKSTLGTLTLGRQTVHFGPSRLSSFLVSSKLPFFDGIALELPLGNWKVEQLLASLENRKLKNDLDPSLWNGTGGSSSQGSATGTPETYGFGNTIILFSSRRFSWANTWLEIGIGANALLTRVNNAFTFGDVLPIFSIHQADVGVNNLSTTLDFRLSPAPWFNIYGMGGFDDINVNTLGVKDGGTPTIWAWMLGGFGNLTLGQIQLGYDLEIAQTHYLWGSFDDEFALSRAIYRLWNDNKDMLLPLTSKYGPGRTSLEAQISARFPSSTTLELSTLLLYGDPAIDLFSLSYGALPFTSEFLLFRLDLNAHQQLPWGFGLTGGLGFDLNSLGLTPRFRVGVLWNARAELRR